MLLSSLGFEVDSEDDVDVKGLAFDSSQVREGYLFFCLVGKENDGHTFAMDALSRGAVAIVVERRLAIDCLQLDVENSRRALSLASSAFYGHPSKRLKMIGVTGTNGKTTTTYIIKSIIDASGYSCGIIGTNKIEYSNKTVKPHLTTPDPIELFGTLKDMTDSGVQYVVMEVSAHALALNKVDGITYEVVAFTNFSRDHLDYFGDMEHYANAKVSLFTHEHARLAVVNADDELGEQIIKACPLNTISYGVDNPSDVFGIDLNMSAYGLSYVINALDEVAKVKFNLTGRFNMYNTLCAAAVGRALDIPMNTIVKGIRNVKKVEGRFNIINTTKCNVIIDFAHTDDGISNVLHAIREFAPSRIITVFGCGGNRDKSKRAEMGRIATTLSDYCFVTSDNPRYEPPLDIILQIERGIKDVGNTNYTMVVDRKEAIRLALEMAEQDDIVLIAGKGAEQYNEVMGRREAYNDERYVMEIAVESGI